MPTSLQVAGSRMIHAGAEVLFVDANLQQGNIISQNVGINLLGPPYVPVAREIQQQILKVHPEMRFLLGGQVISGFTRDQFQRLFGANSLNGNIDENVAKALGIDERSMPSVEKTSLVPAYEQIPDEIMKEYLSREFSFYLSQGCKFACDFCAAVRTFKHPTTKESIKMKESYRDLGIVETDMKYLIERAKKLGIQKLSMYLSNLDVFQTPEVLHEFARTIVKNKEDHPDFQVKLRGLATVDSFLEAHKKNPESIKEMINAGFDTVGFGVDGMTAQVWQQVKKGHNTEDKCLEAIHLAKEEYGITPEVLMVFGHVGVDTEDTLQLAVKFAGDMAEQYGAIPRPHISKPFIPGNYGWIRPENKNAVEQLMANPELFQALDFTALPSPLTHPDETLRMLATKYYLQMCRIRGNTTQTIQPLLLGMTNEEQRKVREFNLGRYDR